MNAKDIAKRLGISRKWLDNFAKTKHAELGDSERFLDWEKYIPEIKEKWAKKTHKQYVAKQYIKLSLGYGTVGYYKPEDLEIIKKYTELFIQLKESAFDIVKLRNPIIKEYAAMSKANSESLKQLSEFLLKELAYQDCLINHSYFTRVNLKYLDFTNDISIEEMKKCVAEKKYPCEEIYEYGRRILEIRKEYHIEEAAKTTSTSYDENSIFHFLDFNYKNPQSISATLKRLQGKKEIEVFYNSFLDYLKLEYCNLQKDFEASSGDYKNYNLPELRKEILKKINETNESIKLADKELRHAYDSIRKEQEFLDEQLRENNKSLKVHQKKIKILRTENKNKTREKRKAYKDKSELIVLLENRKKEIRSLTPKGKKAHISDDPRIIDIKKKIEFARAKYNLLLEQEKNLIDKKNEIRKAKEEPANYTKNIKDRKIMLDLEKDKTLYLRENIKFFSKELKGYKKILEDIDLLMKKNMELQNFANMIKELDRSWNNDNQYYNENIDLLATQEKAQELLEKYSKLSEDEEQEKFLNLTPEEENELALDMDRVVQSDEEDPKVKTILDRLFENLPTK